MEDLEKLSHEKVWKGLANFHRKVSRIAWPEHTKSLKIHAHQGLFPLFGQIQRLKKIKNIFRVIP